MTKPAGTSFAVSGGMGLMTIAKGGSPHDLWTTNRNGLRLTQPAADVAFEVEAVFPTLPGPRVGYQGILVESASGGLLRFDIERGATVLTAIRSATPSAGTILHRATLNGTGSVKIRVARAGATWSMRVARGAGPFQLVAIVNQPLVVSRVGVWAGNSAPNPAFTTKLDSFTVLG